MRKLLELLLMTSDGPLFFHFLGEDRRQYPLRACNFNHPVFMGAQVIVTTVRRTSMDLQNQHKRYYVFVTSAGLPCLRGMSG